MSDCQTDLDNNRYADERVPAVIDWSGYDGLWAWQNDIPPIGVLSLLACMESLARPIGEDEDEQTRNLRYKTVAKISEIIRKKNADIEHSVEHWRSQVRREPITRVKG